MSLSELRDLRVQRLARILFLGEAEPWVSPGHQVIRCHTHCAIFLPRCRRFWRYSSLCEASLHANWDNTLAASTQYVLVATVGSVFTCILLEGSGYNTTFHRPNAVRATRPSCGDLWRSSQHQMTAIQDEEHVCEEILSTTKAVPASQAVAGGMPVEILRTPPSTRAKRHLRLKSAQCKRDRWTS